MTDRELLELAAKAAGHDVDFTPPIEIKVGHDWVEWNPLIDDGDALRLAVRLEMFLDLTIAMSEDADVSANDHNVDCEADPYAATRRAIVRAAAAIGRAMS